MIMKKLLVFLFLLTLNAFASEAKNDHLEPLGWFGVYQSKDLERFIDSSYIEGTTQKARALIFPTKGSAESFSILRDDATNKYLLLFAENGKPKVNVVEISEKIALATEDLFDRAINTARFYSDTDLEYERIEGAEYVFTVGRHAATAVMPLESHRIRELIGVLSALRTVANTDSKNQKQAQDQLLVDLERNKALWIESVNCSEQ